MAERRVWFDEFKVREGSSLKPIRRTASLVQFTKDFGDRTKGVREFEELNEIFNPLGPFATRDKSFPTFYEALSYASQGPDGSVIAIRNNEDRTIAFVDLT